MPPTAASSSPLLTTSPRLQLYTTLQLEQTASERGFVTSSFTAEVNASGYQCFLVVVASCPLPQRSSPVTHILACFGMVFSFQRTGTGFRTGVSSISLVQNLPSRFVGSFVLPKLRAVSARGIARPSKERLGLWMHLHSQRNMHEQAVNSLSILSSS